MSDDFLDLYLLPGLNLLAYLSATMYIYWASANKMSRVFLILFFGLILLACLSTMMYGFWISANNHIDEVAAMFFCHHLYC